jgi:outer membrane protein OmpA-like peptidoglycan-associated protein
MFSKVFRKRSNKSEGESPFWISFADLMTALMTLFLVVMAVTLISVQKDPGFDQKVIQRQREIKKLMEELKIASKPFPWVQVDTTNNIFDLGDKVFFDSDLYFISNEVKKELRAYIPTLLSAKKTENGKWIKRFIVEGFTDQTGSYTHNLKLSTDRSRSVICALVSPTPESPVLSHEQLLDVQKYFSLGGFSSYSILEDPKKSRRAVIRVEFWTLDEIDKSQKDPLLNPSFGICQG